MSEEEKKSQDPRTETPDTLSDDDLDAVSGGDAHKPPRPAPGHMATV